MIYYNSFLSPDYSVGKVVMSVTSIIGSLFVPVKELIFASLGFVAVDFVVGVLASWTKAKRSGHMKEWGFESDKMWRTVYKTVFIVVGIVLSYVLDSVVLKIDNLKLPNLFCGFVCAVEFWSFLENAAIISDHPIFKWLRKFMGKKVHDAIGIDESGLKKDSPRIDSKS